MEQKEIQFRKKRELGEIISDSFEFLKQEHKPLLRLIAIYVLPFLILYGIVQVQVQIKILGGVDFTNPETLMENLGPIYSNVFITSLFSLFVLSLLAATFYSYLEIYIKKGKGNFELSEISSRLFNNGLIALGANLLLFIAVTFGVLLCILPGIYFANTFSLVLMIAIFEKRGISEAFSQSWNLVNKQWWNTFLLNILAVVIIWLIGFFVSLPVILFGVGNSIVGLQETGPIDQPLWYWILNGLSTVVAAIFYVVPYTFLAFQYFNLKERFLPESPTN
jgi:hypothetical protein